MNFDNDLKLAEKVFQGDFIFSKTRNFSFSMLALKKNCTLKYKIHTSTLYKSEILFYTIFIILGGMRMLKLNETLDAKTISGKKYRSPFFLIWLCVLFVVFIVALIHSNINVPQRDDKGFLVGLLCVVWSALPFAFFISYRKPVCVLGEDKFYFFNCEITKFKNPSSISKSIGWTNSSFLYSDIRKIEFLRTKFSGGDKRGFCGIIPSRIVIYGNDFSVTVVAYKSLVKRIDEKMKNHAVSSDIIADEQTSDEKPSGLWGDIITAFENDEFETMWDTDVSVKYSLFDMNGDMISIVVEKNNITASFSIDEESIHVSYSSSDYDDTAPLSKFTDIEMLFSCMREWAETVPSDYENGNSRRK